MIQDFILKRHIRNVNGVIIQTVGGKGCFAPAANRIQSCFVSGHPVFCSAFLAFYNKGCAHLPAKRDDPGVSEGFKGYA